MIQSGRHIVIPDILQVRVRAPASVSWWLSGSIAPANAIAAYQAKGAASLAASYNNLANPGTYDAAPGVAPTWDAVNGWIFNGTTQWLETSIVGGNSYTLIVRFSGGASDASSMVCETTTVGNATRLNIYPFYTDITAYYRSGGSWNSPPFATYTSGVLAVSPTTAYVNGTPVGALAGAWVGATAFTIIIGSDKVDGVVVGFWAGNIQAVALYTATLTDAQVLAVSNAMAAL